MKKQIYCLLGALISSAFITSNTLATPGASKRIEVYAISQSFWDVTPGETLGDIVKQLLPDNPALRATLLNDIVKLNPDAFSQSNPDNLKANVRLWLPDNASAMRSPVDKSKYDVKSFSWGQIYRSKE